MERVTEFYRRSESRIFDGRFNEVRVIPARMVFGLLHGLFSMALMRSQNLLLTMNAQLGWEYDVEIEQAYTNNIIIANNSLLVYFSI